MGGKSGPTTIYVSLYSLHMCPDTTDAAHRNSIEPKLARGLRERERERAREREQERSYRQLATTIYVVSYCYICVSSYCCVCGRGKSTPTASLPLQHMWSHTATYACPYAAMSAGRVRARA